jgi:hypothetical protein
VLLLVKGGREERREEREEGDDIPTPQSKYLSLCRYFVSDLFVVFCHRDKQQQPLPPIDRTPPNISTTTPHPGAQARTAATTTNTYHRHNPLNPSLTVDSSPISLDIYRALLVLESN